MPPNCAPAANGADTRMTTSGKTRLAVTVSPPLSESSAEDGNLIALFGTTDGTAAAPAESPGRAFTSELQPCRRRRRDSLGLCVRRPLWGQSRRLERAPGTSALLLTPDILRHRESDRNGPNRRKAKAP